MDGDVCDDSSVIIAAVICGVSSPVDGSEVAKGGQCVFEVWWR